MDKKVRVRFAPSPTGALHIGGVRTALYNYLFAKKHGGDFILRIEDTDEKRFVPGAEQYIKDSLKWLGIEPTEGDDYPNPDSPYNGVYTQSAKAAVDTYSSWALKLVDEGKAYFAFDTPEELDAKRAEHEKSGGKGAFKYDHNTRRTMRNSLTLPANEVADMLEATPYVIRVNVPRNEKVRFHDSIRGWIVVDTNTMDDKVIMKETNTPTYHLANIVDDHEMKISHVIRGEEWLPSAPLHVLLYNMLGWDAPEFVHLPLILGPSGKLSKRDGDKYGFPVFPLEWTDPATGDVSRGYREDGFLPEAVLNIVALLGWNPGNNVEFMSLDEMIESFSIDRVHKAGAKFDLTKAEWLNREHLKATDNNTLAKTLMDLPGWSGAAESILKADPDNGWDYLERVAGLLKERTMYLKKFWEDGIYFFERPNKYEYFGTIVTPDHIKFLDSLTKSIDNVSPDNFDHEGLKPSFDAAIAATGIKPRDAGAALRGALCDNKVGPSIFDIMNLLGKDEVIARLFSAVMR